MEYVRLGNTGLKVSRLCLGCMSFGDADNWKVDGDAAKKVLRRAWDLGINFFDTANVYSNGRSEEILGEFLSGLGREEVIIATKVYNQMGEGANNRGLSRKHILWQIDESLRRLKTDYVDIYQTHRWDYDTPIDETLSTMTSLVRDNKVRYIGASSMWAWQFSKALYTSNLKGYERFVSMQNLYNLLYREEEREMIPLCKSEDIALIPWSPTAGGFLSGKYFSDGRISSSDKDNSRVSPGSMGYKRYTGMDSSEIVKRVIELATSKRVTPSQIAIAWLLYKGVTSPIIGTSKVDHLEEFVGSLSVKLSAEEAKYVEEPYVPHAISGHE